MATPMDVDGGCRPSEGVSMSVLPEAVIGEILSKLTSPEDVLNAALVSRAFRRNSAYVKFLRYVCSLKKIRCPPGEENLPVCPRFKEDFLRFVEQQKCLERLALEVEDDCLGNRLKGDVIEKYSLWFSEGIYLEKWLPHVGANLQRLTLVDYGQQAIFQTTPLLSLLSVHCKQLKELELRNMFLDSKNCAKFNNLEKLSLRCVKLIEGGLGDLNECMPFLKTITLVTVVGLKVKAVFNSAELKVLCLGLNTKVATLKLNVPNLYKLQLKMACPDELQVIAPKLRALALSMNKRNDENIDLKVGGLEELLVGASEMSTLEKLSASNRNLKRIFLDVPILHFDEVGRYKGVKPLLPRALPTGQDIANFWSKLEVLSIGPGFWYSVEQAMEQDMSNSFSSYSRWPVLTKLILHLVVHDVELSYRALGVILKAMTGSLASVEVYVHQDSKICVDNFIPLRNYFLQSL